MSRPSLVVLLVEDDRHKMLIRRSLINLGVQGHAIRVEQSPSGRGSAEAWVRTAYVKNVNAYRIRRAKAQSALIVVIDADTRTVQERLKQLADALADQAKPALERHEQVARLVPKRNIETWILCLNDEKVDERTDYKLEHRNWNALISRAAGALSAWTAENGNVPAHCIESLRHGIADLKRLNLR